MYIHTCIGWQGLFVYTKRLTRCAITSGHALLILTPTNPTIQARVCYIVTWFFSCTIRFLIISWVAVAGCIGGQCIEIAFRVFTTPAARIRQTLNLSSGVVLTTRLILFTSVVGFTLVWDTLVPLECPHIHLARLVPALIPYYIPPSACLNSAVLAEIPRGTSKQRQGKTE